MSPTASNISSKQKPVADSKTNSTKTIQNKSEKKLNTASKT